MNLREMLFNLVMEECSEIAQAASKCNRFTPSHIRPGQDTNTPKTNLEELQTELTDLVTVLYVLGRKFPELKLDLTKVSLSKLDKIEEYLKISQELGVLE